MTWKEKINRSILIGVGTFFGLVVGFSIGTIGNIPDCPPCFECEVTECQVTQCPPCPKDVSKKLKVCEQIVELDNEFILTLSDSLVDAGEGFAAAADGDWWAFDAILERMEGRLPIVENLVDPRYR